MTDPREMTDMELDAAVASLLGIPLRPPCPDHHRTDDVEYDSEFGWCGWCYECAREVSEVPEEPRRFTTDPRASWEMEEKIGEDERLRAA